MPGAGLRVPVWLLEQGGPNNSGLNNMPLSVSDSTIQQWAVALPWEVTEEPGTSSSVAPSSEVTSPQYSPPLPRPAGRGTAVPFPLGHSLRDAHTPHWPECVHTVPPAAGEEGRWTVGAGLQLPHQAKAWASQRLVQGMLGGREAPPHTVSMAQKVREMLYAVFILGYPQVCVGQVGERDILKAPRSLEEKSQGLLDIRSQNYLRSLTPAKILQVSYFKPKSFKIFY